MSITTELLKQHGFIEDDNREYACFTNGNFFFGYVSATRAFTLHMEGNDLCLLRIRTAAQLAALKLGRRYTDQQMAIYQLFDDDVENGEDDFAYTGYLARKSGYTTAQIRQALLRFYNDGLLVRKMVNGAMACFAPLTLFQKSWETTGRSQWRHAHIDLSEYQKTLSDDT